MKVYICLLLFLTSTMVNAAGVSIIVHPSNNATLNDAQIKNIFLGKLKTFAGQGVAVPLALDGKTAGFTNFSKPVTGKSPKQWEAYWAKAVFTGAGTPPKIVSTEEMINLVSTNPSIIGFTFGENVPANVKIIKSY